ncbi:MAG TPA: DUF1295 domain-containing protein [Thermoanaerobaculia bacterium]|nr:DUF1295 domain-containing protein [Thermoanaerobaculia bacterium]
MTWKVRNFINAHKTLVIPVILGLMAYYDEWGPVAFTYLALHGTYSVLWLIKEANFHDRRFEEEVPFFVGVFFVFLPLVSYYVAAYLITSRHVVVPPWMLGLAISLTVFGVFFHFVSDAQKHYTLSVRKGLIVEGLFARTRNPNYLGEMMIYTGFALLARHWLPWVVLAGWWVFFFRNMFSKDRSISRYPEFAEYRKRAWLLLPRPGGR